MRSKMDDDVYEKYRHAGKIAADAREYGIGLIKEGVKFLEVVNKIESKILEKDIGIAFPINISINEIAAHYSPRHDDTSVFKKGDVVKLDVGVHVDGYSADTASTVEVGTNTYEDMIQASRNALDNAIAAVTQGTTKPGQRMDIKKLMDSVVADMNANGAGIDPERDL